MNRWTLVALLVGVGLGFLLSEALRRPERGRAERASGVAGEAGEAAAQARPAHGPTPRAPQREDARAPARAEVVEPGAEESGDADEGMGLLRVEFAGLPDADPVIEIRATDIEGREDYEEFEAESGTRVDVEWPEGTIRVAWRAGGAMHRCEARVRIRAGLATDLDASDPCFRLSEPRELAVLTVRVPAAGGGWREGADVMLGGDAAIGVRLVSESTNRDGFARFRVKAGTYTLELGTLEQEVTLGAGERRTIELSHDGRGDVVIEPAWPGEYTLSRDDRGASRWTRGRRAQQVFLEVGEYELTYRYVDPAVAAPFIPSRRSLGAVRVVAGTTTVFRHEGQPGAVDLLVDVAQVPDAARARWSVRVGRGLPVPLRAGDDGLVARIEGLEPGSYPVEILADGTRRFRTLAIVGWDSTTRVTVAVPPR